MIYKAFRDFGNWAILGDSLAVNGSSFGLVAIGTMGDRVNAIFGYSGTRTDQLYGHIQEVKDSGAKRCIVICGTNDLIQGISVSVFMVNYKAILSSLIEKGIQPESVYIQPNNINPQLVFPYNVAIFKAASSLGVSCHSVWDGCFNFDGTWISGASNDGTHPTSIYHANAGKRLAESLAKNKSDIPYPQSNVGGLLSNGNFSGSLATATDWSVYGSVTNALISSTNGNKQQIHSTASSGIFMDFACVVGHKYFVTVKITVDDVPIFTSIKIRWDGAGLDDVKITEKYEAPSTARFCGEVICPSGSVNGKIILTAGDSPYMGTISDNGTVWYEEVQVVDITELGLS
jgi:hypothetical protein